MIEDRSMPLYRQILTDLKGKLAKGAWNIGDAFPTDKELMETFGVSSITIRRVILELVNDGWIERRHGIGTFVKKDFVESLEKPVGFFEEVRKKGRIPSAKVLWAGEVDITESLLMNVPKLEVFKKDTAFLITTVHFVDGFPVEVVESYWDLGIGKGIMGFDINLHGLYEIVNQYFGIQIDFREQEFLAISASSKMAEALAIEEGVPLLRADRIAYDSQGKPVEVAINIYHPVNYRCKIVSSRESECHMDDLYFNLISG